MTAMATPGWRVVLETEMRHLWSGIMGPLLLVLFSLFLSIFTLAFALNPEINVLSQATIVDFTVQATIGVGIAAVLILSANSFSGERDTRTLESLLLTPVPRAQLAVGKWATSVSPWLAMLPIAIPYVMVTASGTDIMLPAIMLLIFPGTLLVFLCGAIGVLVSGLSPNNMISFGVAFVIVAALMAPSQLPGQVRELPYIFWFIVLDPITSVVTYQTDVLVDGASWTERLWLLITPVLGLALMGWFAPRIIQRKLTLHGGGMG